MARGGVARAVLTALLGLALTGAPAIASAPALPSEIEALLGSWTGEGTLMGRAAAFDMRWERVLGDRFVRLSFSNAFVDGGSRQTVLEATAYYRDHGDGTLSGTWFDSRGLVLPLQARIESGALVTRWGDESTERGITTYRVTADGGAEVLDTVLTDDGEREFGRARYARTE